jgi:pimeloyl-ACP methyl ester carboxylesterase
MKTELRGVEIDHETAGTGRPVVWGHGLTSSRVDEAVPPVMIDWPRVSDHCALTRYDARGHGASGYTPEPEGYAWAELAKDQLALLDHLGLASVVLGGASMGAATALHTAVIAPERVDALVLVIPPTAWETRSGQTGMYKQMAEIIERRGVELLISAGAAAPPPDPFVGRPEFTERGAERLRKADPVRLAGVFRGASLAEMPAKEAVAAIAVPTLVLAWSGDAGHPVSTAELLIELMPNAELSVASTWEELQTWTDRTTTFISEQ